jgi:hypothetical protein
MNFAKVLNKGLFRFNIRFSNYKSRGLHFICFSYLTKVENINKGNDSDMVQSMQWIINTAYTSLGQNGPCDRTILGHNIPYLIVTKRPNFPGRTVCPRK